MHPQVRQQLKHSLLATFHYFDILGLAPSPFELWRYWINPNRFGALHVPQSAGTWSVFSDLLDTLQKDKLIIERGGFYQLAQSGAAARPRIESAKQVDRKLKRARKIIKALRGVPFLRAVFISGSVALGHAKAPSDIDVLIVAQEGRIWLTRTLVTLILGLSRMRRHDRLTRDRACLNHYITDQRLDIPHPSLYNAFTYAHLIPLWEAQKEGQTPLLGRFYSANGWLKDYLFKKPDPAVCRWPVKDGGFTRRVRIWGERLLGGWAGSRLEAALGGFQKRRIKRDPRTTAPGGRVEVSEHALEFHPESQEVKILAAYNERLGRHISDELNVERDSGLT